MSGNWSRFEAAEFIGLESVPDAVRDDLRALPKSFFGRRYSSSSHVEWMELPSRGGLIRFWTTGILGEMYVDPSTGEVLERLAIPDGTPRVVNSSVRQFARSLTTILDMFPFYDADASDEELDAAADRVRAVLASIDQLALVPDSFWGDFVDDVSAGDFATEQVVGGADPD
jgi:hypothetical protein